MSIVVQKFGGTSMATEETRKKVIDKIIKAKRVGKELVVVVSAIGRSGDPYATDTFINMIKQGNENPPQRELDLLMACGEVISAVVLCNTLHASGYEATVLTGGQAGIITDESYGQADILRVDPSAILLLLKKGIVPIVAGFQGMSESGNVTTLGRGGSDTTASLVGEAVKADVIEIYTDVDGIMTADPRICSAAKVIDKINYSEVFQMADSGAKVIHPRAVEVAMRANIPLVIKNTFTDTAGTYIIHYSAEELNILKKTTGKVITGIAHIPNRVQICMEDSDIDDELIFTGLADHRISIDIINIFPERKFFTIDARYLQLVRQMLEEKKMKYYYIENCCKITLIGERMTGVPGVMARIIRCLKRNRIEILQTTDSLTTISCLIRNEDIMQAVTALHQEFELST